MAAVAMLAGVSMLTSCNEDWSAEQYTHYVSFRAPLNDLGVTSLYVPYSRKDTLGNFVYGSGKSTYNMPVIISGSTTNKSEVTVHFANDPDTLATLNYARFQNRKDLYYTDMAQYATYPENITIHSGQDVGLLPLDFDFNGIDMSEKWVLPLTIVDNASYNYQSHPRKNYAKALLRVFPFNDYSGDYSGSSLKISLADAPENATVKSTIRGYVVNDSTIFFYAGDVNEERTDRANYKVYAVFQPSATNKKAGDVRFYSDNPQLDLKVKQQAAFSIQEQMDEVQPYLEHRYVVISNIEYEYNDYTSVPNYVTRWLASGTLTLERKINTQIPDEDQAIEWDWGE